MRCRKRIQTVQSGPNRTFKLNNLTFFYYPSVVLTDLLLRQSLYISCSFLRKVCIFGRKNSLYGQKRGKKRTSLLKASYFREAQIVNDSTINSFNCV